MFKKKLLSYFFSILLLFVLIRFFLNEGQLFELLSKISAKGLLIQVFFSFTLISIQGWTQHIILKSLGVEMKLKEWFGFGFINAMANYLMPMKTGTMVRAIYLKKKYNFDLSHSGSVLIFSTFLAFQTLFCFILLILFFLPFSSLFPPHLLRPLEVFILILFLGGFLFLFLLKVLPIYKLEVWRKYRVGNILFLLVEGMNHLSRKSGLIPQLIFWYFLAMALQYLRFYFAFSLAQITTDPPQILFLQTVHALSSLVALTPGNLGLQEVFLSLSSSVAHLTRESGFLVAGQLRLSDILVIMSLGTIFSILLKTHFFRRGQQ